MNIIGICAAAIVASILAVFLKKQNAELSLIIALCSVTLILVYLISDVITAIAEIRDIVSVYDINAAHITVVLKCVGICFMTEFSCDCLKDASQSALASAVSFAGKLCIIIAALPLFEEFLNMSLSLCGASV